MGVINWGRGGGKVVVGKSDEGKNAFIELPMAEKPHILVLGYIQHCLSFFTKNHHFFSVKGQKKIFLNWGTLTFPWQPTLSKVTPVATYTSKKN